MNDPIAQKLANDSIALKKEASELATATQGLEALKSEVSNLNFALNECEITMEADAAKAGISRNATRGDLASASEDEKRTIARLLLPVVTARAKVNAALKAYNTAADGVLAKQKAIAAKLEAHIEMQNKFIEHTEKSEVAEMTKQVELTAGLLSFAVLAGPMPEEQSWLFCKDLISDYRAAVTHADKKRAFKNFASCFSALGTGRKESTPPENNTPSAVFHSMAEGPEKTAFYKQHRAEIITQSATA